MDIQIYKPKTRKGLSYPMKTSMLTDAMIAAGINTQTSLNYWSPQRSGEHYSIVECDFWPANERFDYHRFYLRIGVVKSEDRKAAEVLMEAEVIPELIEWMKFKCTQPKDSTELHHYTFFMATFQNNTVTVKPQWHQ